MTVITNEYNELEHVCDKRKHTIFYSDLWERWTLKIQPKEPVDAIFTMIEYCPYCGTDLEEAYIDYIFDTENTYHEEN